MVQVALGLGLGGEVLGPLPLLEQLLREEVAVRVALGVEAGQRVPVPVPGSPDAGARFEHAHRQPPALEGVELVDPGDAGADDHDVIVHVIVHVAPCCAAVRSDLGRCHVIPLRSCHDHVRRLAGLPTARRAHGSYNRPALMDNRSGSPRRPACWRAAGAGRRIAAERRHGGACPASASRRRRRPAPLLARLSGRPQCASDARPVDVRRQFTVASPEMYPRLRSSLRTSQPSEREPASPCSR